jgi:tetratricopeptide (TPR) repeat protein
MAIIDKPAITLLHRSGLLNTNLTPSKTSRWLRVTLRNNYGIALLDALQYDASVHAFEHVASLRPDDADAYSNLAIVEISWERYNDAEPHLARLSRFSPATLAPSTIALSRRTQRRTGPSRKKSKGPLSSQPNSPTRKDDLTASTSALGFLRKHPEVASESVVGHTHDPTGDPNRQPAKIEYHYILGVGF